MEWEIEYTDEFDNWWQSLTEDEQESVHASVELLQLLGPDLRFPYTSGVHGSKHSHMRELRTQHRRLSDDTVDQMADFHSTCK